MATAQQRAQPRGHRHRPWPRHLEFSRPAGAFIRARHHQRAQAKTRQFVQKFWCSSAPGRHRHRPVISPSGRTRQQNRRYRWPRRGALHMAAAVFSGGERSAIMAWITPALPAARPPISRAANIETISADRANQQALAAASTSRSRQPENLAPSGNGPTAAPAPDWRQTWQRRRKP